ATMSSSVIASIKKAAIDDDRTASDILEERPRSGWRAGKTKQGADRRARRSRVGYVVAPLFGHSLQEDRGRAAGRSQPRIAQRHHPRRAADAEGDRQTGRRPPADGRNRLRP